MEDLVLSVASPQRIVVESSVTEVVIPAFDGERGILKGHEDFVGRLGTGPLKYVSESDDYWLMVSNGTYQVHGSRLMITAETVREIGEIDQTANADRIEKIELELKGNTLLPQEKERLVQELRECRAMLEVCRRTNDLN